MLANVKQSYSLNRGVPPDEAIPGSELAAITSRLAGDARFYQYAPLGGYQGDPSLRQALGEMYNVDSDGIFVANGSLQVLDLVAAELLADGPAAVLVETPTYDRAMAIFQRHGGKVTGIPTDGEGLDLDALESRLRRGKIAFLYTIPDFQNPSGVTLSSKRRIDLQHLAARYGLTIVEDIPYRDLRYCGAEIPQLGPHASEPRVITIGSLSKSLSPGLRIGYALADAPMAATLARRAENTYLSPPPLTQAVAAEAISDGLLQTNLRRLLALFGPRRDHAIAVAREQFGDALIAEPEGGYFLSLRLAGRVGEAALMSAALEAGLGLSSGGGFLPPDLRSGRATFLRLPFHGLTPGEFSGAAQSLRRVLRQLDA